MNSAVDEIKAKLSIEELVGQYVQLKKVGRSFKGLCPFHQEKSPSFIVSPDRQIAYCFGCNKGGDVFAFIQEVEGVDFADALKILADRTGVKLESHVHEKAVPKGQKELLIDIYEQLTAFYEDKLLNTDEGAKVLEYLRNRGISDESIRSFRLGFSPDSFDETYTWLLKKGYSKKDLIIAGVALTQETTVEKIYDRFRGRLMFPISDSLGRVVAFGGRALKKDQEPKYLNSPETPIYHKGNIMYGYSHARQYIKQMGEVVVVEGYMDLIAMVQAGVKNVVASSGTALTVTQLRLVNPFAKTLYLAFDMDLAGREAAKRAYELAKEYDFTIKVTVLPEGKDAADFAKSRASELDSVIKSSLPYGEYLYGKLVKDYGTDGYSAKKKIVEEFLPFFMNLKSNVEKDEFIRRMSTDLGLTEVQVYDEVRNFRLPANHPARQHGALANPQKSIGVKKLSAEELFLGLCIEFERLGRLYVEKMTGDMFTVNLQPIYNLLVNHYNGGGSGDFKSAIESLPYDKKEDVKLLSLYIEEKYNEVAEESVEKEMSGLIGSIKESLLNTRKRELHKKILSAEREGDKALSEKLLQELTSLFSNYGAN